MKVKVLISALALVALAGGVAHAGSSSNVLDEIAYSIYAFSEDDFADSTMSRTTFGNALTPADALREPWQYPHLDANRSRRLGYTPTGNGIEKQLVWTQLGNTSSEDTFGAAWLGKKGGGYLGAQLSFTNGEYDYRGLDTYPTSTYLDSTSDSHTEISGYVGYGWAPSERISHGVGLSIFDGTSEYEDGYLDSGFGGSLFEDKVNGDDLRLTYGVRFTPSDNFSWTLEGTYGMGSNTSYLRSTGYDAMGMVTSQSTFSSIDMDNDTLGVAGRLNWYKGESTDYQIRWGYSQTNYDLNNVAVDFQDVGGTITNFQNVTRDDISGNMWGIGAKIGHHDGPLHIYGGLDIQAESLQADVTGDYDSPMIYQFREDGEQDFMAYIPNVAFIYEFNERVALVGGAEYNYYTDKFETFYHDMDVVTPANDYMYSETFDSGNNQSAIRAGVELRFSKLIVDLGLSHTDSNGLEAIDNNQLFFAARFGH